MMDGERRAEFDNVEVIGANDLVMLCRIGSHIVEVSPRHILSGTTISGHGDRGRLVLSREVAVTLRLI